ncbi:MAG: carboxyltransferase domain-containing protein, partial [Mycobacterium sp.]|nr:carboxyltransferase domain-containing protein [Mycobacterium sp.]
MTTTAFGDHSPILARVDAVDGRPSTTYRQAGDTSLLVEFGEMEFELVLNFVALGLDDALSADPIPGVTETAPGFRSVLIRYDTDTVTPLELVEELERRCARLPPPGATDAPSRLIRLPITFDDSQSTAAIARYIHSIRADAPNCVGGNNIDYIVAYNGFTDRQQFYDAVLGTEQWTAFVGFFPGLPFMVPVDPRRIVVAPKYNPTRTRTAEGGVGLGGPCYAIYPVEAAGGYQMFGRSLPVYSLNGSNAVFKQNPLLLRPGDRVKFEPVEEAELMELWEDVRADRYVYDIQDSPFDVGAYLNWLE